MTRETRWRRLGSRSGRGASVRWRGRARRHRRLRRPRRRRPRWARTALSGTRLTSPAGCCGARVMREREGERWVAARTPHDARAPWRIRTSHPPCVHRLPVIGSLCATDAQRCGEDLPRVERERTSETEEAPAFRRRGGALGASASPGRVSAAMADRGRPQGFRWRRERERLTPPPRDVVVSFGGGALNNPQGDHARITWRRCARACP